MPALADQRWDSGKGTSVMMCGSRLFMITFDLAQLDAPAGSRLSERLRRNEWGCRTNVHGATRVTCRQLGASDCSISDDVTSQTRLFRHFNS